MKKSVYSLVLSDGVVAQIDRLAYRQGANRSGFINQILAEYVSYVTPEQRIRDVFQRLGGALSACEGIRAEGMPTGSVMALQSALVYKYNPTVRYQVELYRERQLAFGEMRVSMRTQNATLIALLERFFAVWQHVETVLIGECDYRMERGRFCRLFFLRLNDSGSGGMISNSVMGDLIAQYVQTFDESLKGYFAEGGEGRSALEAVEYIYRKHLASCKAII